jgi:hypothetical protein
VSRYARSAKTFADIWTRGRPWVMYLLEFFISSFSKFSKST